ncbi:MAG: transposase [Saprospiraceae bacterium]
MTKKPNYDPEIHHRRSIRLKGYDYSQSGLYFITICVKNYACVFGRVKNGKMILNELGEIAHEEWLKLPNRFPKMELDAFQIMPNHMHAIISIPPVRATLAVAQNNMDNAQDAREVTDRKNTQNDGAIADKKIALNDGANTDKKIALNDEKIDDKNSGKALDYLEESFFDRGIGATARVARTAGVGDIVSAYKSLVSNRCLEFYKSRNLIMGKLWHRNYYEHIIRNEMAYLRISEYILNNPINWWLDKFHRL